MLAKDKPNHHKPMITTSTLRHLRIPFSFFLSPVFLMAMAWVRPAADGLVLLGAFLCIHLFLYPASNGYNSYFDRDEGSIGGLKKPPKVTRDLYWAAQLFDLVAVLMGFWLGWFFGIAMLIYGLVSKAYSHPLIRLKQYPWGSWLVVSCFQGSWIFLAVASLGRPVAALAEPAIWQGALLSTLMLLGSYPMTQIYQHQEDARRGDLTLSRVLGIRGTFLFTMSCFGLTAVGFVGYIWHYHQWIWAVAFPAALLPVLLFTSYWLAKVWRDASQADFAHTMRLNLLSSFCINAYFIAFFFFGI